MSKKTKILVAILAAVVVLAVGGVVAVTAEEGASTNATTSGKTLLARVAAILGIDQQKLESAFTQAQGEMQNEALDNYLKKLVEKGKITQQQADQYKTWWQSRPDMSQYQQQLREWQHSRPGIPPEMKEWQGAKPDVPLRGGFGARGFRGGMKWGGGPFFPAW